MQLWKGPQEEMLEYSHLTDNLIAPRGKRQVGVMGTGVM